ncbi:MAG: Na+:solute symporter [Candidatus Eremiobacteraeota bacterium]|nr:Na+:solute symporter [Candidatus Eremiobacteraeota bacterium]MBV8499102.1 Na+:solute symporter [Candidatus Eremiobacteraeota bacterium]
MHLTPLDWVIVVASLGVSFVPAIVLARRAGRNITEFFAAGRQAPWWLIGISLVATTFSTDTPNLVTNLVRDGGVAENWVWWSFLLTGMATVFFFARLWRRSGVLTDLEFYELRYAGRAASFVRGFRAIYLGLFFNCWIIATVNLALVKIAGILFGWPRAETLAICVAVPIVFAATAGLWGVMVTDMIQFCITMTSAFAAAYFAIHAPGVGGLHGLVTQVARTHPVTLSILPNFADPKTALAIFVIPLTVLWWSVWYPGAEPGGGSYVAQRMLAARTESDALFGTFAFQVMHYALRPWPWIVVALASTIVYPSLHDIQLRFPNVAASLIGNDIAYPAMLVFLPAGFAGFMVAGIFAAYRSTIETHLNWGTSYLVHDFYQRFIRPGSSQRELVFAGRLVTVLLMGVGVALTLALDNAKNAFNLLLSIGAGTGLIYLLRWFWWRINAWSEVSAMGASFVVSLAFLAAAKLGHAVDSVDTLLITIAVTTIVWLAVTFLTPPVDAGVLAAFYRLVRPAGPGWARVRRRSGLPASPDSLSLALLGWVLGLASVYGALFAAGAFIYGRPDEGALWSAIAVVAIAGLLAIGRRLWKPVADGRPGAAGRLSSTGSNELEEPEGAV